MFSWACTVGYAATGRSPFGDGPAEAVMFRVRHDPANLDGVPGALYALLAQALVKDPRRRPAISEVLGRLLATPSPSVQAVTAMDLDTAAMRVLAAGWPVSSDLAARANSQTQVVAAAPSPLPTPPAIPPPRTGPLPRSGPLPRTGPHPEPSTGRSEAERRRRR
nr:hypothetical protein [Micromonospora sp. DSM 115978]